MNMPEWVVYTGEAFSPDAGDYVELPSAKYPVVDLAMDNYGSGIIVRTEEHGDVVIDADRFDLSVELGIAEAGPVS